MPTRKKVLSKKKVVVSSECNLSGKQNGSCPACGCCCGGTALVESSMIIVFGGLVIALSFFLMQTML